MLLATLVAAGADALSATAQMPAASATNTPEAEEAWKQLNMQASMAFQKGDLDALARISEEAIKFAEQAFSEDHPATLTSINNLAEAYRLLGRFREAEPLYLRALEIYEKSIGADHPNALITVNNLALLYLDEGRYEEAESLFVRALRSQTKNQGSHHPDTLNTETNLGGLYQRQGLYEQAERRYLRTLEARERVLGSLHPDTLRSTDNLGTLYVEQGRTGEAEPLFSRALKARERSLGRDHPDTLHSVANLGMCYQTGGRFREAEPLLLRALEARERTLGQNHPDTLISVNNLAFFYQSTGRFGEAEPLLLRALEARKHTLGQNHPDTLSSVANLGMFYQSTGRFGEAEPLLLQAMKARKRTLGEDHPDTLSSLSDVGMHYTIRGQFAEAESLFLRTLEARERTLGQDHPDTLLSVNNLAFLYPAIGRFGEAEPLLVGTMEARKRTLGQNHPDTLTSVANLGAFYLYTGRFGEAEPLLLQALKERHRTLGKNHPDTVVSLGNFAFQLRQWRHLGFASISYQKLAVNEQRRTRVALESSLQSAAASFERSIAGYSLVLQSWLASSDRHREAELVGRFGKLSDPALTVRVSDEESAAIPFTPLERQWGARFDELIAQDKPIEEIQAGLDVLYAEIEAIPEDVLTADRSSFGTSLQDDVQSDLAALGSDVAMLSIASFADETHFYLITPERGFEHVASDVGEAELFALIEDVRCQLKREHPDRTRRVVEKVACDPDALSLKDNLAALHDQLIAPLGDRLNATNMLILNLQGRLRYAPFAAFYDAETDRYLTERFQLSRFTWGDLDYEAGVDLSRAAGFGMSQATDMFRPLPGVERELKAVFGTGETSGPLTGDPALNGDFTLAALEGALASKPSVLHIASHFDMRPGQDAANSYLLLGDKSPLTLKELNTSPKLSFDGVDLLVLSACSTASATEGSGLEVEGLGAIAQYRGAEAVLATLWNVADASTAEFMTDFYSALAEPGETRASALQTAQLSLIDRDGTRADAGMKDYSDPYHWAPYILMGNIR